MNQRTLRTLVLGLLSVAACGESRVAGSETTQTGALTVSGSLPEGYTQIVARAANSDPITARRQADGSFSLPLAGGKRYVMTADTAGGDVRTFSFLVDRSGARSQILAVGAPPAPAKSPRRETSTPTETKTGELKIVDAGAVKEKSGEVQFENEPNEKIDFDGDGIPNIDDPDDDNDGVADKDDKDFDSDGIPNEKDPTPVGEEKPSDKKPAEGNPEYDLDGDGKYNWDKDGTKDGYYEAFDDDVDGDGLANDSAEELDIDGDGKADSDDGDIDGDTVANKDDLDVDGDGLENDEDPDRDGDGIPNEEDETPNGV